MTTRRERVNQIPDPVLRVERAALRADRLVYLLVANRPIRYGKHQSRILYIGTTEKGLGRIAGSAAYQLRRATKMRLRGLRRVEAFVVWCQPRRRVRMWRKLERAMLLMFRSLYGRVPALNTHGKRIKESDEFEKFSRPAVERIVRQHD